jgi:hypothetical protein
MSRPVTFTGNCGASSEPRYGIPAIMLKRGSGRDLRDIVPEAETGAEQIDPRTIRYRGKDFRSPAPLAEILRIGGCRIVLSISCPFWRERISVPMRSRLLSVPVEWAKYTALGIRGSTAPSP